MKATLLAIYAISCLVSVVAFGSTLIEFNYQIKYKCSPCEKYYVVERSNISLIPENGMYFSKKQSIYEIPKENNTCKIVINKGKQYCTYDESEDLITCFLSTKEAALSLLLELLYSSGNILSSLDDNSSVLSKCQTIKEISHIMDIKQEKEFKNVNYLFPKVKDAYYNHFNPDKYLHTYEFMEVFSFLFPLYIPIFQVLLVALKKYKSS